MNWYYSQAGTQRGPFTESEFRDLLRRSEVDRTTLVWGEGMPVWVPLAEVDPRLLPVQSIPPPIAVPPQIPIPAGSSPCTECGNLFTAEELVEIAGRKVCATCKPAFLQRLQQGAPLTGLGGQSGTFQDGDLLVVQQGALMPDRCVCCNGPAAWRRRRKFWWHPRWVYVFVWSPLLLFVIALIVRKKIEMDVTLCREHAASRKRWLMIAWGGVIGSIVGVVALVAANSNTNVPDGVNGILGLVFGLLFLAGLIVASRTHSILSPARIGDRGARFHRASRAYLDTLPRWPGGEV